MNFDKLIELTEMGAMSDATEDICEEVLTAYENPTKSKEIG